MLKLMSHFQKQEFTSGKYSWYKEMWSSDDDRWQNNCFRLLTFCLSTQRAGTLQTQDFQGALSSYLWRYKNIIHKHLPRSYCVLARLWDCKNKRNLVGGLWVCMCLLITGYRLTENFEYTWSADETLDWKLSPRWAKPPPPTKTCYRKAEAKALQVGGHLTVLHRTHRVCRFLDELTRGMSLCQGTKPLPRVVLHSWVRKVNRRAEDAQRRAGQAILEPLCSLALCSAILEAKSWRGWLRLLKDRRAYAMAFSGEKTKPICISVLWEERMKTGNWVA